MSVNLCFYSCKFGKLTKAIKTEIITKTRESLLNGKDQYSWPPCTIYFRSAAFQSKTIFFFSTKTT